MYKKKYYLVYTIVFLLTAFAIFSIFLIRKRSFISLTDGYNQFYPAYVYIGNYLKECIFSFFHNTPIPIFDFSIGYGNDILTTLSYYGLGDIFNITAIFSTKDCAAFVMSVTTLLKIYCAGIAFSIWARYHSITSFEGVLFASIFYAFSGYTYAFGLCFPTFMMGAIMLPILALGIDILLESTTVWKWSCIWVIGIFIQALNGFYVLYMETIFFIVYFLIRYFFKYKRNIKELFYRILNTLFQYILGVGMAAVLFVPVLLAYFESPRSEEKKSIWGGITECYSSENLLEMTEGLISGPGYGSGLGICIVGIACILILFFQKNEKRDWKILLSIFLSGYVIPFTGTIMNGFSYSTERWLFILYFLIAAVITETFDNLNTMLRSCKIIIATIWGIWTISLFLTNGSLSASIIRWCVFSLIFCVFFYLLYVGEKGDWKKVKIKLAYLGISGVVLVGVINNFPTAVGGKGYSSLFTNLYVYKEIEKSQFVTRGRGEQSNNQAFRTDIYDTSLNASMIEDLNGATSYFSICNPSIYDFLSEYVVSSGIEGSTFTFRGLDGRLALEMIMSVGSYTETINAEEIMTNQYTLPLGFMYDSYIVYEDTKINDVMDKNTALAQTVVLENEVFSQKIERKKELNRYWEKEEITPFYENIDVIDDKLHVMNGGKICIPFPSKEIANDTEFYLYFEDMIYEGTAIVQDLDIEGKRMRLRPQGSYSGQQNNFLIKVPITDEVKEKGIIDIVFPEAGEYFLENIELRRLDVSFLEEEYKKRCANVLNNVKIEGNEISGRIDTDKDAILFMSIPYSQGWSCYLDTVEVPVMRANTGFCAVEVSPDVKEVKWVYKTPGLETGTYISLLSWVVFIFCVIRDVIRQTESRK